MAMQKEDLEQVIKEDLYREAEAIQKEVGVSKAEDVSDDLKKDIRRKLQQRIDTYEEEQIYAGLSEKDREALKLGRKLQAEKKTSKETRRKKMWKMCVASAAAVVLVLGIGMTSMGGPERIVSMIEQAVGGRKVVQVDSDEKRRVSENEDEEQAYQEVKDKFGAEPVRMYNQKKNMKFTRMNLDENLQVAEMVYQYDEKILLYMISAGYCDSSFGFDTDDEIIDKEIIEVVGNNIELTVYRVKKTGEIKCSAYFTYKKLEYFLTGKLKKEDFELILKNLYFL